MKASLLTVLLLGLASTSGYCATQTISFYGVVKKEPSHRDMRHKECDTRKDDVRRANLHFLKEKKFACIESKYEVQVNKSGNNDRVSLVSLSI